MTILSLECCRRLCNESILEPRKWEELNKEVEVGLAGGGPSILERWVFVSPPLENSLVESVPTPLLPLEKPIGGDLGRGRIKRRPVLREGLVVIVDLEAFGTNSSDVLERIPRVENRRVNFPLLGGVDRRRFGAVRL